MKRELSILCRNPQGRKEVSHAGPDMFEMSIHGCGVVRLRTTLVPTPDLSAQGRDGLSGISSRHSLQLFKPVQHYLNAVAVRGFWQRL
jgi:hypothetical protein